MRKAENGFSRCREKSGQPVGCLPHISGERQSETKTENNRTTKSEFYYGKFQRVIPLSVKIQNTNVTADYKDGILNLTLPKSEQEKNKVVKVNLEQPAA